MTLYLVKVRAYLPYQVKGEYRQVSSNFAVAIRRAVGLFRQEHPRRKIKQLYLEAIRV